MPWNQWLPRQKRLIALEIKTQCLELRDWLMWKRWNWLRISQCGKWCQIDRGYEFALSIPPPISSLHLFPSYTYLPYAHFSLNPFLSSPISLFVYFSLRLFLFKPISLFARFSLRLFLFSSIPHYAYLSYTYWLSVYIRITSVRLSSACIRSLLSDCLYRK